MTADRWPERAESTPWPARVAVFGDSVTFAGYYLDQLQRFVNEHFPAVELDLLNRGVPSETVSGLTEAHHPGPRPCLLDRLDDQLRELEVDHVVLAYGMNDAVYAPWSEQRYTAFRSGLGRAVAVVAGRGPACTVLTPPAFVAESVAPQVQLPDGASTADYSFLTPYAEYDGVLDEYARRTVEQPPAGIWCVADVHTAFATELAGLEATDRTARSPDGIHPSRLGHWIIARTLLRSWYGIVSTRIPPFVSDPHERRPVTPAGTVRHEFVLDGREGVVITPRVAAPGRPWLWRTEFPHEYDEVDRALSDRGWTLAHYRISDLYGGPTAMTLMQRFHDHVVAVYGLSSRASLVGMSRGGLYALNYAIRFPGRVNVMYLDAPVVDLASWPGGGRGDPHPEWRACLAAWGLSASAVRDLDPVAHVAALSEHGVAVVIVAGDRDELVPYVDNGARLVEAMRAAGGTVLEIVKPGAAHHPHGLADPAPVADFVERHASIG